NSGSAPGAHRPGASTVAPTASACMAANPYREDTNAPGTSTTSSAPIPVSSLSGSNDPVQDARVRTTARGRPVLPELKHAQARSCGDGSTPANESGPQSGSDSTNRSAGTPSRSAASYSSGVAPTRSAASTATTCSTGSSRQIPTT